MPLAHGTRFGPYEILAPLGAGGDGRSLSGPGHAARPRSRHQSPSGRHGSRPDRIARFQREAKVLAALNHPHIAQIYGVGPDHIAMELVDSVPLQGPLPLGIALRLAIQLADALQAAHAKGIVHRDLKPANLLHTKSGFPPPPPPSL